MTEIEFVVEKTYNKQTAIGSIFLIIFLFLPFCVRADVACDITGDNKTGLAEAVYSLKVVSGLTPVPGTASIVGSWGKGYYPFGTEFVGEPEYMSITFYPTGYYIHFESGQSSETCDNGGGVEYGTYTYDAENQELTATPIVDNNGCVGLADGGVGGTYSVTVYEDFFEFDGDSNSYQRVIEDDFPIVGSWGSGYYPNGHDGESEAEYISMTFYPNGYYLHYETGQASEPCDNGGGVEYGTYNYNPASQLLTIIPIVDANGCVGMAEDGIGGVFSATADEYFFSILGDDPAQLERNQ